MLSRFTYHKISKCLLDSRRLIVPPRGAMNDILKSRKCWKLLKKRNPPPNSVFFPYIKREDFEAVCKYVVYNANKWLQIAKKKKKRAAVGKVKSLKQKCLFLMVCCHLVAKDGTA